jgi:hypothetical protein
MSASWQIRVCRSHTELPTVVLEGEERVTVHCEVERTVLSESVTLPGLAVTVRVGVLPHEGVCQKAGELGCLLQLHFFPSHSGIPPLEGLPQFIVEYTRARL